MQHTETYKLKIIDADDPFSPDALNANAEALEAQLARVDAEIARIDAALLKFACGTYTGNGSSSKKISLPFTPKMVYVGSEPGYIAYNSAYRGGVALEGTPATLNSTTLVAIVDRGFQVYHSSTTQSANYSGMTFCYFAIG